MQFLVSASKKYISYYSGLSRTAWEAILLTFLEGLAGGLSFVLSLYFVNVLHFSVERAGYLVALYSVGTAVGGLLAGRLSDVVLPRFVSTVSIFAHSMAYVFLLYQQSFFALGINLFVMGICSYGVITSNRIWIMKISGSDAALRLKTLNISYAASNLALGISSTILGLFSIGTMYILFQCAAVILFFSGILLLFLSKELPENIKKNLNAFQQKNISHPQANFKIFLFILMCLCVAGFYVSQMATTYNIFVEKTFPELGLLAIGILSVINTFSIVFFQAPLVSHLQNKNKLMIVGVGLALMGCGFILLNYTFYFFSIAVISAFVYVFGEMLFFSVAQLICFEKAPTNKRGQAVGIFQFVYSISKIGGPAIGGIIYQYFGASQLWFLSALLGLLFLLFCFYYRSEV